MNSLIGISIYSFFTTILVSSVFMIIFILITSKLDLVPKIPLVITYVIILILGIRVLLPVEFNFMHIISSERILPFIDNAVVKQPIHSLYLLGIPITIVNIFLFIWAITVLLAISKYLYNYYSLYSYVKYIQQTEDKRILKIVYEIKQKYNLKFRSKIIVSDDISYPAEFGLVSQTIFIGTNYSDSELYDILFHELTHFRIKTNIISFFFNIIKCIYWWNPLVHLFSRHLDNVLEIYVDNYVSKNMSITEKIGYMECILKVYKGFSGPTPSVSIFKSITGNGSNYNLLNRCKIIENTNKNNIPISISLLLILVMYVFFSGRYVIQPKYEPPISDSIENLEFNEDNSYIIKDGDLYILYYNGEPLFAASDANKLPKIH